MASHPENEIIHRSLNTDAKDNPSVQIAEAVADIEGKDPTDLASTYSCMDGVLDSIFSDPPAEGAQMQVEFSYEGYRITVEQNGSAKFVKAD